MSTSPDEQASTPLDKLLDVGVFAPLGLALEFQRLFPELAEAGRKQVSFSRSLGKAALSSVMAGRAAAKERPKASTSASPANPAADQRPSSAIEGYDGLSAKDIIAVIRVSDASTVDWIRSTETAGKARVTVLRALDRRSDELG